LCGGFRALSRTRTGGRLLTIEVWRGKRGQARDRATAKDRAMRKKRPKTIDCMRPPLPALVFPPCSLTSVPDLTTDTFNDGPRAHDVFGATRAPGWPNKAADARQALMTVDSRDGFDRRPLLTGTSRRLGATNCPGRSDLPDEHLASVDPLGVEHAMRAPEI